MAQWQAMMQCAKIHSAYNMLSLLAAAAAAASAPAAQRTNSVKILIIKIPFAVHAASGPICEQRETISRVCVSEREQEINIYLWIWPESYA